MGAACFLACVFLASALTQSGCGRGISDVLAPNAAYCDIGCPTCAWSVPAALSDTTSPDTSTVYNARIALTQLGFGVLAWQQNEITDTVRGVLIGEHQTSTGWTLPADAESPLQAQAVGDVLVTAVDTGQKALAVWLSGSAPNQVRVSERSAGNWSTPFSASVTTNASVPVVAMNEAGEAIVAWVQLDDQGAPMNRVFYAQRDAGGNWSLPGGNENSNENILSSGTINATTPQVAMNADGDVVVAWVNSTIDRVQYREYIRGSGWGTEQTSNNLGGSVFDLKVAIDDSGRAVIAWIQYNGDDDQVYLIKRGPTRTWTSFPIASGYVNDNASGSSAQELALGMDGRGNAIVSWSETHGGVSRIVKLEIEKGVNGTAGVNDLISTGGKDAYFPSIAMNARGDAILAWTHEDASSDQRVMVGQRFAGGAWAFRSDADTEALSVEGDADRPWVAMDCSGRATVVWKQAGAAYPQVYRAEFR